MQKLFGAEDLHAAMRSFDAGVKAQGLTSIGNDDGIILGASKPEQVIGTVEMIRKGPLPGEVMRTTEKLWDAVKVTRGEII